MQTLYHIYMKNATILPQNTINLAKKPKK